MNAVMQTTPDMGGSISTTALAVWIAIMCLVVPIVVVKIGQLRRAIRRVNRRLP